MMEETTPSEKMETPNSLRCPSESHSPLGSHLDGMLGLGKGSKIIVVLLIAVLLLMVTLLSLFLVEVFFSSGGYEPEWQERTLIDSTIQIENGAYYTLNLDEYTYDYYYYGHGNGRVNVTLEVIGPGKADVYIMLQQEFLASFLSNGTIFAYQAALEDVSSGTLEISSGQPVVIVVDNSDIPQRNSDALPQGQLQCRLTVVSYGWSWS